MITRRLFAAACALALAAGGQAEAQTEVSYVKASKKRDRRLNNCAVTSLADHIIVRKRGRKLELPKSANRRAYSVPGNYNYFGCGIGSTGQTVVFAKRGANGTPVELALTDASFAEKDAPVSEGTSLRAQCKRTQRFPGSFIYKTIGSHHFTDCRRNTQGLIVKPGVRAAWPGKADVLDTEGNKVSVMGLYATGGGWSARYYACVGAGTRFKLDGFDVARKAQRNTGSNNIYLRLGSTCFGPIRADKCIGSKQC